MMIREALTFDDVLLQPQKSAIGPNDACIETEIDNYLNLKTPLISAAMDTVTEHKLAIAMAQLGGLGVIHKNFSIKEIPVASINLTLIPVSSENFL